MNRRDFLQKVSDLVKGSVAAITLSKVEIAAVAASLATVSCEKENPLSTGNSNINVADYSCPDGITGACTNYYNCRLYFLCIDSSKFSCKPLFICPPDPNYVCDYDCIKNYDYKTGAAGQT